MWKTYKNYEPHTTPNVKPSNPEPVGKCHQGPRRGVGPSRLRRRERRAAARSTIDISDTTEEAVDVNETSPEPVEVTEPAENAENTEKY